MRRRFVRSISVAVSSGALALGNAMADIDSLIAERHPAPDLNKHGEEFFPFFAEAAFLTVPCHPEADGYFGGTFGQPVEFEYVFEMETNRDADTPEALKVIRENVVSTLVADTFPQVCGIHRRQLRDRNQIIGASKVNGFWFDSLPKLDLDTHCEPFLDKDHLCGVFRGKIHIYGHNLHSDGAVLHVMSTSIEAVGSSQTKVAPFGVMRLVPSEKMTKITYGLFTTTIEDDASPLDNMTTGAKVGLGFSSAALGVGMFLLGLIFIFDRRQRGRSKLAKNGHEHLAVLSPLWGPSSVTGTLPESTLPGDESLSAVETIYLQESPMSSSSSHDSRRHVVSQLEENDVGAAYQYSSDADESSGFFLD